MFTSLGNVIPRNGLVGEWSLDGNALDTSGKGNNGTATNVTYVKTNRGYQAQAGSFGGSSYITASSNGNLNGDFTISGWFNALTQTAPAGEILNFGIDNFSIYLRQHNTSGGYTLLHPTIQWNTSQYTEYNLPSRMNLGWTFFTMTVNRTTNKFQYSQNGVFQNELTIAGIGTFNNSMNIGQGAVNNYRFKGQIQGVRIYNRVLSQDEIQILYLEGQKLLGPTNISKYPKLFEGLVGYWDFRGSAHNLVDGVAGTVTGATLTTDRFGNSNSAYSFDGVNDMIDYGNNYNITGDITLSAWIYATKNNNYEGIISKSASTTTNVPYELRFNSNNGSYSLAFLRASTSDWWFWSSPSLTSDLQNKWAHIVVTNTGGVCKLYVNGDEKTMTLNRTLGTPSSNSTSMRIGTVTTLYFGGNIGLSGIFNKALSADEVKLLYNLTSQDYIYPSPSYDLPNLREGLVLDLNEQGKDLSGNGNHGTLVNSPTLVRQGRSKGLSYNGSNQGINNTTISTQFTEITMNIWNKQITTGNDKRLLFIGNSNTEISLIHRSTTPGHYGIIGYIIGGSSWFIGSVTTSIPNGTPVMLTLVAGSNYNKLYVNGVQATLTYNQGNSSTGIGNQTYNNYCVGFTGTVYTNTSVFNPRIRNRALSDREIQQLYYSQKLNYTY